MKAIIMQTLTRNKLAAATNDIALIAVAPSVLARPDTTLAEFATKHRAMIAGAERRTTALAGPFTPEEMNVAIHEASHTVACLRSCFGVSRVELINTETPNETGDAVFSRTSGRTQMGHVPGANLEILRLHAAVAAAGHMGTMLFLPNAIDGNQVRKWPDGSCRDADDVLLRHTLCKAVGPDRLEAELPAWRKQALVDAAGLLMGCRAMVQRIADELLRWRVLEAPDLGRLLGADVQVLAHAQYADAEAFYSIDVLRWIKRDMSWSSRSPSNFLSNTEEDNAKSGSSGSLGSAGPAAPTYGDDSTNASALHVINTAIDQYNILSATESDGTPPHMYWLNSVGDHFIVDREYAYGITTSPTDQLACAVSMYICSDDVTPDEPPHEIGSPVYDVAEFNDYGYGLTLSTFKEYTVVDPSKGFSHRAETPFPSTQLTLPANPPNLAYSGVTAGDPYYPSGLAPGYTEYHVGFYINRQIAILKFDVEGGLTYVD